MFTSYPVADFILGPFIDEICRRPGITSQAFTWILVHDSRGDNSRTRPIKPLVGVPLQLVRSEGQNQHSYFLKTSYTMEDTLESRVHGTVTGMRENGKRRNSKQPKRDHTKLNFFQHEGWTGREKKRGVTIVESRLRADWVQDRLLWLSNPHPFVRKCMCVYVCVKETESETQGECDCLICPPLL